MMEKERPEELRATMSDARYNDIPIPCQHCTHLTSLGSQFSSEGWTCEAYPQGIRYGILTGKYPHSEVTGDEQGMMVAYKPRIYKEDDTGREWHYTADGSWVYVDNKT